MYKYDVQKSTVNNRLIYSSKKTKKFVLFLWKEASKI